ncbi:T9SS type B sorting domain-containing protein [Neolewinella persica]|uniref:T9SS type B sorting domain-containing protein n=1 Tax=Neolewinella persica TaxID=70998 RepID=UPI00037809C0|nr:gliding motility-associated C-terminal domain-containing protein [Neolewinella persica]
MRLLLIGLTSCFLLAAHPGETSNIRPTPLSREDCSNGLDDDGDGMTDLRDPDCSCHPRPLPIGPELITNGGFEELADIAECTGCVSLFSSDNCPLGWQQESVNLHTPCYTAANPAVNIGYVDGATGNYQGVGGYGRANESQRQQEEYLATQLDDALESGLAYRFAANFSLPEAGLDGINEAAVHRIVILGSRSGTQLQVSPERCYSEAPAWDQLATINIVKGRRASFTNYVTSFVAGANYRYLAIASDCCQAGEDTLAENLTYWAIDNVSLKAADLDPIEADITFFPRSCDQDLLLCTNSPPGVWSYQWYQDSAAIVGATEECLPLAYNAARGQNFSVWITGPDNCQILSRTLPITLDCGPQPENCTNGFDDDGDGLIDELDPDCDCQAIDFDLRISASPAVVAFGERTDLQLTTIVPSALISWSPAEGLSCNDCPSPSLLPMVSGVFTATVLDPESGCTASDSIRVSVLPDRSLYLPDVFSPNADGLNDVWRAYPGPGVENLRGLRVFDRWGNLVFNSPTAEAWEGQERPAGYYVFQLLVRFIDGHEERIDGNILLIR